MWVVYCYRNKTKKKSHKLFLLENTAAQAEKYIFQHSFSSRLCWNDFTPLRVQVLPVRWQHKLKITHFGPVSFFLEFLQLQTACLQNM
jgi:hypothetical protein